MLQQLNQENFEENIKDGIKLVAFTTNWCGFCQRQKPILQEIADNKIWIGEVDADNTPSLVQKYGISGFPSFLLFKEGKLISSFSGFRPKYDLLNEVLNILNK